MAAVASNSALAVLPSTDAKPAVRFIWAQGPDNDIVQMANDGQWKAAVSITKPLNLKPDEAPKSGSPIAVAGSKDLKRVRVYYIATNDTVSELCWDATGDAKGFDVVDDSRRKIWTRKSPITLSFSRKSSPLQVSPATDLAAFIIESSAAQPPDIRLYVQSPSLDIIEYRGNVRDPVWGRASIVASQLENGQDKLGNGVEGTRISVVGWSDRSTGIEGYFQTKDGQIVNTVYVDNSGVDIVSSESKQMSQGSESWVPGKLNIPLAINPGVKSQPAVYGLASIRFLLKGGKPFHRVYAVTPVNSLSYMVLEYEKDSTTGTWTKPPSLIGPVLGGTRLAAHGWNTPTGPELHLYLQNGADGAKVVDWTKLGSGAWTAGPVFGVKGT